MLFQSNNKTIRKVSDKVCHAIYTTIVCDFFSANMDKSTMHISAMIVPLNHVPVIVSVNWTFNISNRQMAILEASFNK